jgi:predicted RNA-binding protein YlqC (UPF0109 family)
MSSVKSLIETVVCSIVDDTGNVQIEEEDTGSGILYKITVSKGDVGKLIGKGGRVASALRTVSKAAGAKQGVRVLVNVMNKPLEE